MLGLALGLSGRAPAPWWPADAVFAADFPGFRFRRRGNALRPQEAFDFARASPKWARRADGNWQRFDADLPALTDLGLSIEPAAGNLAVGAGLGGAAPGIVGLGGSLPTGWAANGALVTQVLELTTLLGLPAIHLRISGVASSAFYEILFTPLSTPMDPNTAYSASVFAQCSTETVPLIELRQGNSSDSLIAVNSLSPALGPSPQRPMLNLTTNASTAMVRFRLARSLTLGNSYSMEVILACPQLERGPAPSSPLLASRAADALDLNLAEAGLTLALEHDSGPPTALSAATATYRLPTALPRSTIATILASPP